MVMEKPGENTTDPIEAAVPAEASGQTMTLCVWFLPRPEALVHGPPMSHSEFLPSLPAEAGPSAQPERQMISPAVLGKPCHRTVPGSWPPTRGAESRSPGLEGIPGGGR